MGDCEKLRKGIHRVVRCRAQASANHEKKEVEARLRQNTLARPASHRAPRRVGGEVRGEVT